MKHEWGQVWSDACWPLRPHPDQLTALLSPCGTAETPPPSWVCLSSPAGPSPHSYFGLNVLSPERPRIASKSQMAQPWSLPVSVSFGAWLPWTTLSLFAWSLVYRPCPQPSWDSGKPEIITVCPQLCPQALAQALSQETALSQSSFTWCKIT